MPKDPSSRSLLSPKSRGTLCRPYPSQGRGVAQGSSSKEGEEAAKKDWEESTCPICMEYPHNAVLLMCSSHDKGCRPYMCDTSYRHSNCLDQYRKAKTATDKLTDRASEATIESVAGVPVSVAEGGVGDEGLGVGVGGHRHTFRPFGAALRGLMRREEALGGLPLPLERGGVGGTILRSAQALAPPRPPRERAVVRGFPPRDPLPGPERLGGAELLLPEGSAGLGLERPVLELGLGEARASEGAGVGVGAAGAEPGAELADLLCPLCRGKVFGWTVVEPARHQLNRKPRSCAQEACGFTGNYKELREHARAVHPTARPSDIDPVRQRDWRRLERQRDLGDVLSTIRSAMPGATVLGDYVIEDEEEEHEDDGEDSDFPGDDGNWWTVFLLFQVFGPAAPFAGGRGFPGRTSRLTRGPGNPMMRQALWGETFQGNGLGAAVANHTGSTVCIDDPCDYGHKNELSEAKADGGTQI
ncbi:hypothetical protein AXG93_1333s1050 [Marchantia polymorpha subsp. ruderalis]|uniref:Uncharacterized protein n=1 Tax=Marchantia polymorpha subsp. ruderalis TaxID=1480154 RepID=A0A176WQW2_MARPO|nr:hypothetical protein AXG93_1333s1050 [Marchantia polymorpha subsp. ruderalis]